MNSIELSELLYGMGYTEIFMGKGVDIEKMLLGYNSKPINLTYLHEVAMLEGYTLIKGLWFHESVLCKHNSIMS